MPQEEETKEMRVELCLFVLTRGVDLRFFLESIFNGFSPKLERQIGRRDTPDCCVCVLLLSVYEREHRCGLQGWYFSAERRQGCIKSGENRVCKGTIWEAQKKRGGRGKKKLVNKAWGRFRSWIRLQIKKKYVLRCVDSTQSVNTLVF